MLHLRNILVPIDFSPCSEVAVQTALEVAGRVGGNLHLMHVWPKASAFEATPFQAGFSPAEMYLRIQELVEPLLGHLETAVRNQIDVTHDTVQAEHPAQAILSYAQAYNTDLIVMGTHGRRGLKHWILGSVTEEVLHEAVCPVMAVREKKKATAPQQILVPIDFSEASGKALAHAKNLASLYEAELTLLFVAEEYYVPNFSDTGLPVFTLFQFDPEITAQAAEALRLLDEGTLGPEVATTYLVRKGQAHRTIISVAKEKQADLIVMATHGLGQPHGLIGSVTNRVVRLAPCPVWTIHVEKDEGARLHRIVETYEERIPVTT